MRRRFTGLAIMCLVAIFVFNTGNSQTIFANGNEDLNLSHSYGLQGDVVSAGVGLRGVGYGDIFIEDIPSGAEINRAFLYWATLGNANTYTSPTLNGTNVDGALIGTSGDTCWGVQNNFVYRADVTDLVTGNGTYTIAGLPDSLSMGNDSQGASLVVIYSDLSEPYRTILLRDGAVSLDFDTYTYTDMISDFIADDPVTDAHITFLIGDGQSVFDTGSLTFEDYSLGIDEFSGIDGDYWGTHTYDVTGYFDNSPVYTTIDNNDPNNPDSPDCLLVAGIIFSVTSPVPEVSNDLSESYERKLYGDVTSAGIGLRGSGEGMISLTGIPSGGVVADAFLYWATLGSSDGYISPELNGISVEGEHIGTSADTCWGALYNYVYRADVTDLVSGNGDYYISGLPSDLSGGNDSQGAGLVVIYYYNDLFRWIFINDGAVTLDLVTHEYTDTIGPFTVDQPESQAHITYLVGDGQSAWSNGNVEFDGTTIANNVFTGVDGDYWGTLRFDVSDIVVEPDATTTINNDNPDDPDSPDCLLWAATVFSAQTEQPVLENPVYLPFVVKNN